MRALVLSIGDELLADRPDSNGPEIARELLARGLRSLAREILPDEPRQLAAAIRRGLEAGGLVVLSGGLGPTVDDLTREAVAEVTGLPLRADPGWVERLDELSRQRGGQPTRASLRQAELPAGAVLLPNPAGTAPGFVLTRDSGVLLALPGPPAELEAMLPAALDAALAAAERAGLGRPEAPRVTAELRVAGLGESLIAERLRGLPELESGGAVQAAWLARPGDVSIHLRSADAGALATAVEAIRGRLGEAIYSEDGKSLPACLVERLAERFETVGTVESCTGGLVAGALSSVPGCSQVLRAGLVTYSNESKTALASVPVEVLAAHGAVSRETVELMASGGRRAVAADWVLAVSGIAGPAGGTPEKPVGTVWLAVALPDGTVVSEAQVFPGPRELVRRRAVAAALDLFRRQLR